MLEGQGMFRLNWERSRSGKAENNGIPAQSRSGEPNGPAQMTWSRSGIDWYRKSCHKSCQKAVSQTVVDDNAPEEAPRNDPSDKLGQVPGLRAPVFHLPWPAK